MPDKTYVKIGTVAVKEAFDNKYKSSLPKVMRATIEKAIKSSSKLTTSPPSDDGAKGFRVDVILSLTQTDKGTTAEVRVALLNWPEDALIGSASGKGTLPASDLSDGDVEDLVTQVLESVFKKQIIKEFEKGRD